MKLMFGLSLICAVLVPSGLFAAADCADIMAKIDANDKAIEQNRIDRDNADEDRVHVINKMNAWSSYSGYCFASLSNPRFCWYDWKRLKKSDTRPAPLNKCDEIHCAQTVTVTLDDGSTKKEDQPRPATVCRNTCRTWWEEVAEIDNCGLKAKEDCPACDMLAKTMCEVTIQTLDNTLPSLEALKVSLETSYATLCAGSCSGLTGPTLDRCMCIVKGAPWTWDVTTTPASCVPCSGMSGEAKDKCVCEKVEEGIWDSVKKACSTPCAGKTGEEYKICVCESQKWKWDAEKKSCIQVQGGGDTTVIPTGTDPSITSPGTSDPSLTTGSTASSTPATAGATSKPMTAQTLSLGGVPDYGAGSEDDVFGGGGGKKKSGTSWFKSFVNSLSSTSKKAEDEDDEYGSEEEDGEGGDSDAEDAGAKKTTAKAPSDIMASKSSDIFEIVHRSYTKKTWLFPEGTE